MEEVAKINSFRTYVYVWVEGVHFSPKQFRDGLEQAVQGTVEYRKRMVGHLVERVREHWKSSEISASDHQDAISKLYDLLTHLRPALLKIKHQNSTVMAEIVSRCDRSEEIGLYLPSRLINLLSEVEASLDFDQYLDEG